MEKIILLSNKVKKTVIGLMSGTSLDGSDVVLVEITGNGLKTRLNQIDYIEFPFPTGLKELILRNSAKETSNVEDICRLNFLIPRIYADGIKEICKRNKISLDEIDLIGTHGQTIHHLPEEKEMFGYKIKSTLQIGDPAVIAKLTGVITVGDFRTGDIALGGEGAPLVPYFDYLIFHSTERNRALLNIGGISNITVIKKNAEKSDIFAFDTGPGNMMIDYLMKRFFNTEYDKDGETASTGKINNEILNELIAMDNFIERNPPKSTGRELYGSNFLEDLLEKYRNVKSEDWISTITHFTSYCVYRNYEKFIMNNVKIDELIVSGGGVKNKFILNSLKEYFGKNIKILTSDEFGISSDAKEALCFAVLANETIAGNTSNITKVTGALKETILGKICLP